LFAVALLGCTASPKEFAPSVEITRKSVVRYDPQTRQAVTLDVEVSYADCPGTQLEVIRGGAEFAACMAKHQVGARVPLRLRWHWSKDGHYMWDPFEVGGCARPPDPNDEASFVLAQDCETVKVNGAPVGFHCNRVARPELVAKCPWFRRH